MRSCLDRGNKESWVYGLNSIAAPNMTRHLQPRLKLTAKPISRCWNVNCGQYSANSSNRSGDCCCDEVWDSVSLSVASVVAEVGLNINLALSRAPVVPLRIPSNMLRVLHKCPVHKGKKVERTVVQCPIAYRLSTPECGAKCDWRLHFKTHVRVYRYSYVTRGRGSFTMLPMRWMGLRFSACHALDSISPSENF